MSLRYFFFKEDIKILYQEFNNTYQHNFEKPNDLENVPFSNVYFSTVSDLNNHVQNIQRQHGDKYNNSICLIDPEKVMTHEAFPINIGYKKDFDEALKPFKKRNKTEPFKVAIINAMSNAIGDHLIGMRAFDSWLNRIKKYLDIPIEVSFFQLNPMRMGPITAKREELKNVYILPNQLPRLTYHDAYIDLSSIIVRENFSTLPMTDFFLQALSVDPESVPDKEKRIKFSYDPESVLQIDHVMKVLRSKGRPILLFHHKSTSSIREMSSIRARKFIKEIIDKTDYFVVSAVELEFQNERYLDISRFSAQSMFHFASIIDKVDAAITVDTSTYHFADAFETPTVALFTTIEPSYRTIYYPFVQSIMLENYSGKLYGRHKSELDPEKKAIEDAYVDNLWEKLSVDEVIELLEEVKQKKRDGNYERCNSSRGIKNEIASLDEGDEIISC